MNVDSLPELPASNAVSVQLEVKSSCNITGRGAAAFFVTQPVPPLRWKPHVVIVRRPDGSEFEAIAQVEFVRTTDGEDQALRFEGRDKSEIPAGSRVQVCVPKNPTERE